MKHFFLVSLVALFSFGAIAQSFVAPNVVNLGTNNSPNSISVQILDTNTGEDTLEVAIEGGGNTPYVKYTVKIAGAFSNTVQTLPNLNPNTTYLIKARVLGPCSGIPSLLPGRCESPWSSDVYIKTQLGNPPKVNLTNSINCPTIVGLTWEVTERADEVSEFFVHRSYDGVNWESIKNLPPYTRDFYDLEMISGRSIRYRVISQNIIGKTAHSDFVTVNVSPFSNPKDPINVRSDQTNKSNHHLTITWENPVDDNYCRSDVRRTTIIRFKRKDQEGFIYKEVPPYYTSVQIDGLNEREPVEYIVFYISDRELKSNSPGGIDTTLGPPLPPKDLIIVSYKDALSNSINGISWKPGSSGSDYYVIETSTDSVNFSFLGKIKGSYLAIPHFPINEGQKYYYRAKAGNIFGESIYCPISYGIIFNYSEIPARPVGLIAKSGGGKVNLSWTDASDKEENFEIYRSDDGTTYSKTGTVGRNILNYSDVSVSSGKSYYYQVKAVNPLGSSDFSNFANVLVNSGSGLVKDPTINIFPNPTSNLVSIELPGELINEKVNIKVVDFNNHVLISKSTNSKITNISLSKLNAGMYSVIIESDNLNISKKIVKY
ncbi:MAG: T9SS type A sorting domain-containing protein [Cytophagaceae bacterium]|nr:T9SS type A sorting domain-containing protein [Cytophagaceae bacterium]MBK9510661.1 T9SS type A sorting domain-containing protein [Cytophagaceae bacterium]MBK9934331.1 T9SS type A sorting domain-containing protein [Cytophagaceae bacterium]MBL0300779.1 T9SS type A sorting domain-containing protein [Cytophagaceae bacterium]MBL0327723.1 T9SS type A sorting domain-containing protein [Cytophagaceae bacterium]